MSKFTRVRTKITSLTAFCRALETLKIQYHATNALHELGIRIPGGTEFEFMGQRAEIARFADVYLNFDSATQGYSLGYSGDYGQRNDAAIRLILQQYALTVVQDAMRERGMEIVELEKQPDGSIRTRVVITSSFGGQQPSIEARIHPDGTVEASVSGMPGQTCAPVVHQIQVAVGGEVLADEPSPDWWGDDGAALWRSDYDQTGQ